MDNIGDNLFNGIMAIPVEHQRSQNGNDYL